MSNYGDSEFLFNRELVQIIAEETDTPSSFG
jgi:hypothetical protein